MSLLTYDPRLFEVWRRALASPVRINLSTKAQAVTLRHRLYRLRAELRRNDHPLSRTAERAKISLMSLEDGQYALVIASIDDEFDAALRAAKITIPKPPPLENT